jgi:hypothetical protein
MGKDWDKDKGGRDAWVSWMTDVMRECLRVLKPGAHGLVWALPRTSHWTATALENAGFEIRDVVTHLFGTGFPKSLDVSKAIDKAAGAERKVVGRKGGRYATPKQDFRGGAHHSGADTQKTAIFDAITAPATDSARQWQGWGTALKPASEHWILVRKKDISSECDEIVLSAVSSTQLTKHGWNEAEALLAPMLAASNATPAQRERTLQLGRAVVGLDTTAMSLLARLVVSIDLSTVSSWKDISDDDLSLVKTFTTRMATRPITASKTSNSSPSPITLDSIKPNSEHVILVRKPLGEKTVAANVLKHGTGGINVDGCRVASSVDDPNLRFSDVSHKGDGTWLKKVQTTPHSTGSTGRFPANLVLSHSEGCAEECEPTCAVRMLDEQSGITKSGGTGGGGKTFHGTKYDRPKEMKVAPNEGGASRFFYCAKASRSDRQRKADENQRPSDSQVHQADELFDSSGDPARRDRA